MAVPGTGSPHLRHRRPCPEHGANAHDRHYDRAPRGIPSVEAIGHDRRRKGTARTVADWCRASSEAAGDPGLRAAAGSGGRAGSETAAGLSIHHSWRQPPSRWFRSAAAARLLIAATAVSV
jgi:hypothetical protein